MRRLDEGLVHFLLGLLAMPLGWRLWVALLVAVNVLPPLFFVPRLEAWATLGAIALAAVLMAAITAARGFTRLLGAGHAPWLVLLPWIVSRWPLAPADEPFGLWLRALVAINAASLVFDLADVARYAAGERGETVDLAAGRLD